MENEKDFCITCKHNYTIFNDNGINKKICLPSYIIETTIIYSTNFIQTIENEKTQLTETLQPIETTQIIVATQSVETTQLIEVLQPIKTTQLIESQYIDIHTTQLIEVTEANIDESQPKEPDTTQTFEYTELKIITTLPIQTLENTINAKIIEKIDTSEFATNNKEKDGSENCSKDEILKNQCESGKISSEQIGEVYDSIKENILTEDYHGENTVIQTENVIFQIST